MLCYAIYHISSPYRKMGGTIEIILRFHLMAVAVLRYSIWSWTQAVIYKLNLTPLERKSLLPSSAVS